MTTITPETARKLLIARSFFLSGDAAKAVLQQATTVTSGQTIRLPSGDLVVE